MYKIKWDPEINGILLDDKTQEEIVPPRPVFHEELDLLGFEKYWEYERSERPLLWSIGRQYYYKGIPVAEARGGNIYELPELIVEQELSLKPIDIDQVIERNKDMLSICENDAKDFVQSTYRDYQGKVDYFAVAFSGGKDSQVVLDIVSQMLAPDEYIVIFTDTTMEIPFTYDMVEETKKFYRELYPGLKFYEACPPQDSLFFWEKDGSPSRFHRWCCSVCKTAPFANLIRRIHKENGREGQPKILVFEGVRAEESDRRSRYEKITPSVKRMKQINAESILFWNLAEVFLYLFYRNIPLNNGYRYGLSRIGCSICPFGSEWSENILREIAKEKVTQYMHIIEKQANLELSNKKAVREYISKRQWKKRAGGRGIDTHGTGITFIENSQYLKGILSKPEEEFFEWLKTIGEVLYRIEKNKIHGEIKIEKETFNFDLEETGDNKKIIQIQNVNRDIIAKNRLKRILYKTTYCIHCGACEAECPTGALRVIPKVVINKGVCIHCARCLDFVEKGCLRAKSVAVTEGGQKMNKGKIATSKYQTFGMRKVWVEEFLNHLEAWFEKTTIGPRQIESMIAWLKDCELLDQNKNPTELAKILKTILPKDQNLAWEIIWINFFYNIKFIRWYVSDIPWNSVKSFNQLVEMIIGFDDQNKRKTTENTIKSLFNLFQDDRSNIATPLGDDLRIGIVEKRGRDRYIKKIGTDNIHPLAIAYCLYKLAEDQGRYDFTASELYEERCEGSPYRLFGISREKFEDALRYLQEGKDQLVRVDLKADLDNIFLREDITSKDIIRMINTLT